MDQKPKRVAVIGLDCALPHLIEKHIADGHLPTFKKLIEGGVIADNCLVPFPTVTPPNWATIATGAWAGTHGITDFHYHLPGTTPDNVHTIESFSSERWQAESIWNAADKAGKKCIVLNFPGAWPSTMKNGVMVGGSGLSVSELRDGHAGLSSNVSLCADQMITTGIYPLAIRGKFEPANGWTGAGDMGQEPLEMAATLNFPSAEDTPAATTWYLLARQSADNGYDTVTLSSTKDLSASLCTLKVGEWSPRITTAIAMAEGPAKEVFFRCKLVELSEDAEDLRFFVGAMCAATGWSDPPEVASEIISPEGSFAFGGGLRGYSVGWIDERTYVEINEQYGAWLADAATALMKKDDWDVFFMHAHPPDWFYHVLITEMDEETGKDPAKRRMAWETHLQVYEGLDRMIARIVEAAGEDTLVILVSDHGATPDGPMFDPYKALVPAGLTTMHEDIPDSVERSSIAQELHIMGKKPNIAKSKAIPQREIYVYINLKGRDPEGIVALEDYANVQQEIIDALLSYVDPKSGKRPIALALAKQDARILGLYGDQVGDVVYALYPWFGSQHGQILPTGEWGVGSLKGLLTLTGPGIKEGFRLQRTCGITDLVPTVCYLLDLPLPEQAEGAVLYQAFKDPNFKLKEVQRLREGLAKMEASLSGKD